MADRIDKVCSSAIVEAAHPEKIILPMHRQAIWNFSSSGTHLDHLVVPSWLPLEFSS